MSDALHIFAKDSGLWSDRTTPVAVRADDSRSSEGRQRLLALAAALGAWSLVALVGGLAWFAIG